MADPSAQALYERLTTGDGLPAFLARPVREAVASLEAALRLYTKDELLISFNGGKDATVVLHIARAVFAAKGLGPPRCVYWVEKDRFAEVHDFVMAAVEQHALPLLSYTCTFGEGLRDCVETHGVTAVVLGTRQSDPKALNAEFEPSSPGWPPFMRVNPIMSWDYGDVWRFLHFFRLPYCSLYDAGYTSLGNRTNTLPNPFLRQPNGAFTSACWLLHAADERAGRQRGASPAPAPAPAQSPASAPPLPPARRPRVALLILDSPSVGPESLSRLAAAERAVSASGGSFVECTVLRSGGPDRASGAECAAAHIARSSIDADVVLVASASDAPGSAVAAVRAVSAALWRSGAARLPLAQGAPPPEANGNGNSEGGSRATGHSAATAATTGSNADGGDGGSELLPGLSLASPLRTLPGFRELAACIPDGAELLAPAPAPSSGDIQPRPSLSADAGADASVVPPQQQSPLVRIRNVFCVPFGPEEEYSAHLAAVCSIFLLPADGLSARIVVEAESCPRIDELAASVRMSNPGVSADTHAFFALDCSGRRADEGRLMVDYGVVSVRAGSRAELSAAVRSVLGSLPAAAEAVVQGGWVD